VRAIVALACVALLAACSAGGGGGRAASTSSSSTSSSSSSTVAPSTTAGLATSTPTADVPCGTSASPPARYDHVVWIFMENKTRSQVIGSGNAPYETSLAARCGTATRYAAVGSPSLPNYIGATSGDTWGIGDDNGPGSHVLDVDNIFRQVRAAGTTEGSFEESMSAPCQLSASGSYAVRHNPATYYQGNDDRAACQRDDVSLGSVDAGGFRNALDTSTLPTFSFVTPNTCDDTHDCPVRTGDDWLARLLPVILGSAIYRQGRTAVFVAWDEDTPMPFIAVSPSVRPGTVSSESYDHFSLLRTAEEMLGLPLLRRAAGAHDMRSAFGI